jgi:hypothetical protein
MPTTPEISHGIRMAWACRVVHVCQGLVEPTLDGEPTSIRSIADWLSIHLSGLFSAYA